MDSHYGASGAEVPAEVAVHLEKCARCRQLYGWLLSRPAPAATGLEESILQRLTASLKPVKRLPSTPVLALRFLAVFAFLIVVFVGTTGMFGVANMSAGQLLAICLVLGAGALLLALSLSWQMTPGARQRISTPAVIGIIIAGFAAVVGTLFPWEDAGAIFGKGWSCTRAGLMMSVPAAALLLWLATRGAPLRLGMLGASLGATAGLIALTALQLQCHNQHAGHLIVWHGGVVVLCILAGYFLGRLASRFSR